MQCMHVILLFPPIRTLLVQVQLTMMVWLLLTSLHRRVSLKLLTTSSLCHNNVSSQVHSVVQYSYMYSLYNYTAAVTGENDSRSEDNIPPPTMKQKGSLLFEITDWKRSRNHCSDLWLSPVNRHPVLARNNQKQLVGDTIASYVL